MTGADFLAAIIPEWRQSLPPSVSRAYFDSFIARKRPELEAKFGQLLARLEHKRRPAQDNIGFITSRDGWLTEAAAAKGRHPTAKELAAEMKPTVDYLRTQGFDANAINVSSDAGGRIKILVAEDSVPALQEVLARAGVPSTLKRYGADLFVVTDPAGAAEAAAARAAAPSPLATPVIDVPAPADNRTKGERLKANVAAVQLVVTKRPGEFTASDLRVLLGYSGHGGLSIEQVREQYPPELRPETFGLIHEYYTPTPLADAIGDLICRLLPELVGRDGYIRALEPSAGIGRLVRAVTPRRCLALQAGGAIKGVLWTTVEYSRVSSRILRAIRPDTTHFEMPFERWINQESERFRGTINLILSNPPYGERGAMALEDPDDFYRERSAFAYFMRRALDLLVPGGVGVFLVPAGFLSSKAMRALRARLLRRHHLVGAFRIPSHDLQNRMFVPGAFVVMDLLVWRSRGGELTEDDADDAFIVDGSYYDVFPKHILGTEEGALLGEDSGAKHESEGEEATGKKPWKYKVVGEFTGLPELTERALCTTCQLGQIVFKAPEEVRSVVAREGEQIPDDVEGSLRTAVELGNRVGRYLAAVAAVNPERASQLWAELHPALLAFAAALPSTPWGWKELRTLSSRKVTGAQLLLNAFDKAGKLVPALDVEPLVVPRYQGRADDIVAQAESLFRQARALSVPDLLKFHRSFGNDVDDKGRTSLLRSLFAADWNLDGDDLYPFDVYTTGKDLWARHDRAAAWAKTGDAQAQVQVRRLLEAIKPAVYEDIADFSPQDGYMPLALVSSWVSETLNAKIEPIHLEREGGLIQARGIQYGETSKESRALSGTTVAFLGWLNHDLAMFKIPREARDKNAPRPTKAEREAEKAERRAARDKLAKTWRESFRRWVGIEESRREQVTHAYNRANRGRVVPTYTREPLEIARWGEGAPRLKPHQVAGARRILDNRGGLLAFDVGVGKTYTAIAVLAHARQSGWVRRPVILVPSSLVWKWHDDIRCTLPDYRVAVIGSNRKRLTRGERRGVVTSETDTGEQRASKWTAFQAGQTDLVILSFDALSRTKMSEDAVVAYIEKVEAVARSINLRKRNLTKKGKDRKGKGEKLSERDQALVEHGVRAWVEETLRLPAGHEYDPGVRWDELGIDMLIVDEAAAFKNLYMPEAREDGVPKFMGSAGEGSHRAWQLDFRAASVRHKTGGTGIVLLTATPAKNSPLEFYNVLQFVDPAIFSKSGIHDPEQFIDTYLRIEQRDVLDTSFNATTKPAVVGFKNLDDLRTIIFSLGEFRTAEEVGLKLPKPIPQIINVDMDDAQEEKYDRFVSNILELLEKPKPGTGNIILGMLARLSMIALHASGDEGYTFKNALTGGPSRREIGAESLENWETRGWSQISDEGDDGNIVIERDLPPPDFRSPKFIECAKRIAASQHCGHIVFCEPTATHQWLREIMVAHGIPRERIAILNAEVAAPADRVRIAREFNGLSGDPPPPGTCAAPMATGITPKFDVVIANSVAYEGVDMQVRTCTIHHIDLPWTSSDLEQRNGRAVRQGNTLGTVNIFYYFADRSTDGYRFSLIDGKATWLADLLKSNKRDTNNPGAQQQLSPEDILIMISRDKEKTMKIIEERKAKAVEEARQRRMIEATHLFKQANARFRDARNTTNIELARRLRDEGESRLAELELVDPAAWPWTPWMYAVRETEFLVPDPGGAPLFEGLRVSWARPGNAEVFDHLEFGRVLSDADADYIGRRAPGSGSWEMVRGMPELRPGSYPHEGGPAWPADDEAATEAAIGRKIAATIEQGKFFEDLQWEGASDAWLTRWWPLFGDRIAKALAASSHRETVPVVVTGRLQLRSGLGVVEGELLPPTRAGWARYLELAPASGHKFTELLDVGRFWWERRIPQRLLSDEETSIPAEPSVESVPEPAEVDEPSTFRPKHFPPGLSLE